MATSVSAPPISSSIPGPRAANFLKDAAIWSAGIGATAALSMLMKLAVSISFFHLAIFSVGLFTIAGLAIVSYLILRPGSQKALPSAQKGEVRL